MIVLSYLITDHKTHGSNYYIPTDQQEIHHGTIYLQTLDKLNTWKKIYNYYRNLNILGNK